MNGAWIAQSVYLPVFSLGNREIEVRFPSGERDFLFSIAFRLALERTRPPIQWIAELKMEKPEAD
jgi:hypothetical protein